MCDSGGGGNTASAEKLYNTQAGISQEMFDNWKSSFRPVETKTISDVAALTDPARIEQRVQTAQQDVSGSFDAARNMQRRQRQSVGLNPSDGMYDAADRGLNLAEAGARAGAATRARDVSRTEGLNAEMGLIQTGRGIANSAQAGLSSAASGFQSLGAQQQGQANSNNAATGSAIGSAVVAAAMFY